MKLKKYILYVLFCGFALISVCPDTLAVYAAAGPVISTTLTDNSVQQGRKKTFEVRARNSSGNKIKAVVRLNGVKLEPTWDDSEKTSYTLIFTKEGQNTVTVSATSDGGKKKELTYSITYKKANNGDKIGTAVWSIEAFTIGCGYLIYPTEVPIYEGETAADRLLALLNGNGFTAYYGGNTKASFYLAYIADGTAKDIKYNNYTRSSLPNNPEKLKLTPTVPELLIPHLNKTMSFFDMNDYVNNWEGYLGEFAFTNGSGWMFSVNGNFPNVGFADTYLSDGDTVRVQYTLGYGADIGGFGAVGSIPNTDNQPSKGYYTIANKDSLTKAICSARSSGLMSYVNVKKAYNSAISVMSTLDASQRSVDEATNALSLAISKPRSENVCKEPQSENSVTAGNNKGSVSYESDTETDKISPSSKQAVLDTENDSETADVNGSSTTDSENNTKSGEKRKNSRKPSMTALTVTGSIFVLAAIAAIFIYIKRKEKQ